MRRGTVITLGLLLLVLLLASTLQIFFLAR